jgi:hypothetical protein
VQAEEAEELPDERSLVVARRAGVRTPARGEDVHLLAGQQTLWALLGVPERHARPSDVVEVGLERRRHAEVVHRQADHDDVGAPQLVDQRVGVVDHGLLRRSALACRQERLEALGGEVGPRRLRGRVRSRCCAGYARASP